MINLSNALRDARSQAIAAAFGANAGLTIYDGTRPAPGAALTDQVALVILELAGATSTGGVLTFDPIPEAMAQNNGTATWARITSGAFVADLGVFASGSGGDIELSNVNILAGALIQVTAAQISEP